MKNLGFIHKLFIVLSILVVPKFVAAQSAGPGHLLTYEGVLTDSADNPITPSANVVFQVVYTDASETDCVVYEETRTVLTGSKGEFSVVLGEGIFRTDVTSNTSEQIFAKTGFTCTDHDPALSGTPHRYLRIKVDGSTLSPDIAITNVPFAIQASNAEKLDNKIATDFIQVNVGSLLIQSNVESIFNRYTKLDAILNNFNAGGNALTGNATTATTATNVSGVVAIANGGTGAATQVGAVNAILPSQTGNAGKYLTTNGTDVSWATSDGVVASVAGRTGAVTLQASDITDFSTASDARITAQKGVASGLASLDGSGKVPSAQLSLSATDIPNLDASKITSGTITQNVSSTSVSATTGQFTNLKIYDGTANYLTQVAPSGGFSASGYSIQWPASIGATNQVLQISSISGSVATLGWVSPSGGSVTSVAPAGTPGNPISIGGTASVPTIDIPAAGAGQNGYLSSSDFATFSSKQPAGNYITALTGDVTAAGPGSAGATISNNVITTSKIADGAVTTTKALTTNPGINRIVATDGITGTNLAEMECATVGHVLSWTVANGFQCSAISSIYSAPVASVAGKTGVVSLVSADIGDATSTNTASMLVKRDASGNFYAGTITGSGLVTGTLQVTGGVPAVGKVLTSDASGNAFWQAPTSQWITSGSNNIYYNTGNVGIGTTTPGALLDVIGDIVINGIKVGKGTNSLTNNTALGKNALDSITTGNLNTAIGYWSLKLNNTGAENVGVGTMALSSNTSGAGNIAVGRAALASNGTGNYNTAVGRNALNGVLGNGNIGIGNAAGMNITSGSYNVVIGSSNGSSIATTSNNIILSDGLGNERMQINASGNVGIGTSPSSEKLSVNGDISASGLKLGTTSRTATNGGPASSSNKIVIRSFVSNSSTDGTVLFETPEWRLERNGTYDQFRLVSLSAVQTSYWARSGTDYWKGSNPGVGLSVTFAPTPLEATEFQIFLGIRILLMGNSHTL